MNSAKIAFVLLLLLRFLIPSQVAHADISPPPAPELGGLEPFEYQDTNVQMVYERVEMEIQPFSYDDPRYSFVASRVNVTAYFIMHNNGSSSESMQAIFPLESFSNCRMGFGGGNSYTNYFVQEDSFAVTIGGNKVPIQKVETDHPFRIEDICEKMSWIGFDVTFPVDDDVVIKVQYVMETMGRADAMQNIEYILETGAGWAGPIQRGYVIVKFPYVATAENVLFESTPGYQFLYNEVFWSFENLEPTSEDNIHVSIVSPDTWQRILSLQRDLRENPQAPEKWLELAQIYFDIATWHWDNRRSDQYFDRIASAYERGIAENPNNAELYAKYAEFEMYMLSPRLVRELTEEEAAPILSLLNKSLALDPDNELAQMNLSMLQSVAPSITFTPPPTIPPTATSLFTETPSVTPSTTITPVASEQNQTIVITVVHTKLVKASTPTRKPIPTRTSLPTESPIQDEPRNKVGTSPIILGALIVFLAGVGVGTFWSKKSRK
ncbi:MAG TPA: hypothetical protein VFY83_04080 [Anaerolineales bacterium]|nr:hypothetical protein [Anaerolineales bacterium]